MSVCLPVSVAYIRHSFRPLSAVLPPAFRLWHNPRTEGYTKCVRSCTSFGSVGSVVVWSKATGRRRRTDPLRLHPRFSSQHFYCGSHGDAVTGQLAVRVVNARLRSHLAQLHIGRRPAHHQVPGLPATVLAGGHRAETIKRCVLRALRQCPGSGWHRATAHSPDIARALNERREPSP